MTIEYKFDKRGRSYRADRPRPPIWRKFAATAAIIAGLVVGYNHFHSGPDASKDKKADELHEFIEEKQANLVEEKQSLEKKVFIYSQDLDKKAINDKTLAVCDYFVPHMFEIDIRSAKRKKGEKSHVVRSAEPEIYSRASRKTIDTLMVNASRKNILVTPMVSAFKQQVIEKMLENPEYYASSMADKIKKIGAKGVVIDFESVKIDSAYSPALIQFMKELRSRLTQGEYSISIAVSPRFNGSAEKGFSHHGFYDFRELSKHVDYVQLMCYDFHKTKVGPVLPQQMFEKILQYASQTVPSEKIVAILPFYGYAWRLKNHTKGKGKHKIKEVVIIKQGTLSAKNSDGYLKRHTPIDEEYRDGELYVKTKNSIAYIQNGEVFRNRFAILQKYGIYNVAGWRESHSTLEISDSLGVWKKE